MKTSIEQEVIIMTGAQTILPKYCLACGTEIIININWKLSNAKKSHYRCNNCFNFGLKAKSEFKNLNKIIVEPKCRICNIKLCSNNWRGSSNKNYICKPCMAIKNKEFQYKTKYNIIKNLQNKKELLESYGNKCNCCGCDIWQFLTLDHVYNDGNIERANIIGTQYENVKRANYPKDRYQLLCMNCNYSKGHNGFCPHKVVSLSSNNCFYCKTFLTENNQFSFNIKAKHNICKNCVLEKAPKRKYTTLTSRASKKADSLRIKQNIIEGYGASCECCGESEYYFMTIDHIYGGGRKENKKLNLYGKDFYSFLMKQNFPNKYRLLCYNCNCCMGLYGKCYHDKNVSIEDYKEYLLNKQVVA